MHMKDWIKKLDGFLSLNERDILTHSGKITHKLAVQHAEAKYEEFNLKRIKSNDAKDSDFDRSVKMIEQKAAKRLQKKKGRKNYP